ncbi:cytochrome P450 [Auriculariales sp. MPI-PUGE-AT-0066]|nr:cytochrome P450 [Auriculariales sp. MPI-PUGE-AT-0066]
MEAIWDFNLDDATIHAAVMDHRATSDGLTDITDQPELEPLPSRREALRVVQQILDTSRMHWTLITGLSWKKQYGDLVYGYLAGTSILLINSREAAKDLLIDRGAQIADRPRMVLMGEIVGWENSPITCKYSHPSYKMYRRMVFGAVGARSAVDNYSGLAQHETHRFLRRILEEPERLLPLIRLYAGAVILRIVYGYDVNPNQDYFVDLIQRSNDEFDRAMTPGAFMVDLIPALRHVPRWFPGTGWMRLADSMRQHIHQILTEPAKGRTTHSSFVSAEFSRPGFDESIHAKNVGWAAMAMYTAGGDTTSSANYSFFLAMTAFPEAQAKAQAEIDSVLGLDTLPTWKDAERLPYVCALVREVMRWAPVAVHGFPHVSTEEIYYNGFFIPKGTITLPNVWGFTRDATVYPDPETFAPERFFGPNPQPNPYEYAFGFGRRACPGQKLAELQMFLLMASTLATLTIMPKVGADGSTIQPKISWSARNALWADKWEYDIKARSKNAEALIRSVHDTPYAT